MNKEFDFNKALEQLKAGKPITGGEVIFTPLIRRLAEVTLESA